MAHLYGSSVLSIFAENSVRQSIGDLTTGLAFWYCVHNMRSRVYKTVRCLSDSQSVPSVERSSGVRRVCCWAPYAQKISSDSAGRPAAAAPQPGAAARAQQQMRAMSCWQPNLRGWTQTWVTFYFRPIKILAVFTACVKFLSRWQHA